MKKLLIALVLAILLLAGCQKEKPFEYSAVPNSMYTVAAAR